jgi:type II secretory pathway predicted ATPase ExeA
VVTGEVGAGKTVAARAAVAALDPVRHTIVYLANPLIGQRGLYAEIVRSLGGTPASTRPAWSPRPPSCWPPRRPRRPRPAC